MAEPSGQPYSFTHPGAVAPANGVPARWLVVDDDLALGCESANPLLQIEQWGQEVLRRQATSS
jgi:hypothetical protein